MMVGLKELNNYVKLSFVGISLFQQYSGADKSLARPGRKQAIATEDFDFGTSYL